MFNRICKYSFYNSNTTIGENMRYFMYKYNLMYDDWFHDLNNIYIKIEAHIHNITKLDDVFLWLDQSGNCVKPAPMDFYNSLFLTS